MKFTDLFIRRPVLAIVVNLVILIAGLQSIRSLSVRAVPAQRHRGRHGHDGLRRRERGPRARLHHDAARARDRERRRHRLHRVVERAGRQHDHGAPEAQLRHERRADADPGEGRAGAQRPAARGAGADHRPADGRQPVRGDVPRLLLERPRPEPDHRLPDARRPAEADRGQRRAARGHPRRPHVRDARLAEAGPHGGARHLALAGARRARREQLPLGARADQGLDGLGQPRRQHRPADASRSSSSSSSSRTRASSCGSARSPTSCSAPRTTTRTSASTARPRRSWASGCCRRPTRSRSSARVARGDEGDPGAAAGRHEGRHPLRLDRVHPQRDRRGA